jgi:hypothetical protein
MISKTILLSIILFFTADLFGQARIFTGKVIDQNLYPLYQTKIFIADTVLLGTTDLNGNFKIEIPAGTKSVSVGSVAMEPKSIGLTENCTMLDIILINEVTYDFMSAGKVDRLRKKEFDKLPALHRAAFEKGIFKTDKPCYIDKFISYKKELKAIHKSRKRMSAA